MNRKLLPLSVLLFALSGQMARAQIGVAPVQPLAPPAVSPFLNLRGLGVNPAIALYGINRPQAQTQAQIQQLQQATATQALLDTTNLATQPLTNTGTGAGFMTSSKYFLTNGRAGSSSGGTSTTGYTPPTMFTNTFGANRPH